MRMIIMKTPLICIALLVCFGTWGLAAESSGYVSVLEGQRMVKYLSGEIGRMEGGALIISGKEYLATPSTIYYDENRNKVTPKDFKRGDQIAYEYDVSTSELIYLQKKDLKEKIMEPGKKQEDDAVSTKQNKQNEKKIHFTDGVYKN